MDLSNTGTVIDTEVLILGAGAAGCGAAIAAKSKDAIVTLVEKGKLESSGCLGGGNDHFMAILNSGLETDTAEAVANFFANPLTGLTPCMIKEGWVAHMPVILDLLQEIGVEFVTNPDGSWFRTVGFGQPGNWWINIKNGQTIKKRLGKKIRDLGINVFDHVMVTKLITVEGEVAGAMGFDVLCGTFYIFRAKKVVIALGNTATRGWTNSTGNPYNIWQNPYNTGSFFVLAYDAGVKLLNLDIGQRATMITKSFGSPGMNGINSMGGYELNALGERFMGKYDPMWENCKRINQINGTYQELIEGKGPPFYYDMRHLDEDEVYHLQHVLMPGDKATYSDFCKQKDIDYTRDLLEVEISELCFSGSLLTDEKKFKTNVDGLYNACVFFAFSGAICGGYHAGANAAEAASHQTGLLNMDKHSILLEKDRIFKFIKNKKGISYKEFENAVRQVMNYYMGYRRNQKGMETALEKLSFLETYGQKIQAFNHREMMKANESHDLVRMCRLATQASMERKESGRTYYQRSDYPKLDPNLKRPFVMWQEANEEKFAWGI